MSTMISSTSYAILGSRELLKQYAFRTNFYRHLRSLAGPRPKLVQGKMKTLTQYDPNPNIQSYQDLLRDVKESGLGDEFEVEKAFVNEDLFGDPLEKSEQFYSMHFKEEKAMKSAVKKHIIKNKYFKLDRETNLLTYAAKAQIRHLHATNPQEWNPKALAECFPISEAGVKKLLKSSFSPTHPEKIKTHDEEVAERWKILKSGKFTTSISSLTQKLYREGKLKDDYFSGNPNLPTKLPEKKIIQVERKKPPGEFSKIVQTYVQHEKQKLLASKNANQVVPRKDKAITAKEMKKISINKFKLATAEFDKETGEVFWKPKETRADDMDLPLSRFKEILQEEDGAVSVDENDNQTHKSSESLNSREFKEHENYEVFSKISKYDKEETIDVIREKTQEKENIYKYDNQYGYQYPVGKTIQKKIRLPAKLSRKGKLLKRGQYVYSENGEFLYKLPT